MKDLRKNKWLWIITLFSITFLGPFWQADSEAASTSGPSGKFFLGTELGSAPFFPITVGGMTSLHGEAVPADTTGQDKSIGVVCKCPAENGLGFKPGFTFAVKVPVLTIESVKTPMYSPTMGSQLTSSSKANGAVSEQEAAKQVNQYVHGLRTLFVSILQLWEDMECLDRKADIDYLYFTENFKWKRDPKSSLLYAPESFLFANFPGHLANIPVALAADVDLSLDPIWWGLGNWGLVYPLTDHVNTSDTVMASAALAARAVFEMNRDVMVLSKTRNMCKPVASTIWDRKDWTLQPMRPSAKKKDVVIGKPSVFWGRNVNPPYKAGSNSSDEFMYVVWQKHRCCEPVDGDD